ncbi:hypothetical protein BH09MYX1_BH09MYX1_23550 [soil metagenome]
MHASCGRRVTSRHRPIHARTALPIPRKHLTVRVSRSEIYRKAGLEVRLIASVEVRSNEMKEEVLVPKFGPGGETMVVGAFSQVYFDAVTGELVDMRSY